MGKLKIRKWSQVISLSKDSRETALGVTSVDCLLSFGIILPYYFEIISIIKESATIELNMVKTPLLNQFSYEVSDKKISYSSNFLADLRSEFGDSNVWIN